MTSRSDAWLPPSIDDRLIALMRLVLASSALLVTRIDPSEAGRNVAVTSAALVLYTAYSGALYILARRGRSLLPAPIVSWADVGWYVLLVGLSSGTDSVFFLFFFAILVASFQRGFSPGLHVTLVSTVLFTVVGLATAPPTLPLELNRFLLRPVYLLVLGYMMASWAGSDVTQKRRLGLLKNVAALPNPRFGADHTIELLVERLRAFYDADTCVLVMGDPVTGGYSCYRAGRRDARGAVYAELISESLAEGLFALPPEQAVVYPGEAVMRRWWHRRSALEAYEATTDRRVPGPAGPRRRLPAESVISVPLRHRGKTAGRLSLAARRRGAFRASDVAFLTQVLAHAMPTIESIRLVDQLASDAAETERQRIARDLHDSVIQPYIGLQMGLAAIRRKLIAGSTEVTDDIERLLDLTEVEMADLRHRMNELKQGSDRAIETGLLPALRRFSGKFTEATGITTRVETDTDVRVNDRLAAEVIQIVAEGLSNVRRHTTAARVAVRVACRDGHLVVRIENDTAPGSRRPAFTPLSITERAAGLGGRARVEATGDGVTAVIVEIPL